MTEARPCHFARLRLVDLGFELVRDIPLILPRKSDELGMASASYNLIVLVQELDRGVSQSFADLFRSATAWTEERRKNEFHTFVADYFAFDQVPNRASGVEVRDAQVCRDSS